MDFDRLRGIFANLLRTLESQKSSVVTLAGTNGKGETAHNLMRLATESKKFSKIMMWTSPHIYEFSERFNLNGKNITYHELMHSLHTFLQIYPQNSIGLSFYELSFWLFCHQASLKKPDLIILEVGLGGRLDAVNLLNASVSIITSISRDHTEFLGKNLKDILMEKIQIVRPNSYLIYSVRTKYLKSLVKKNIKSLNLKDVILIDPESNRFANYQNRNLEMAKRALSILLGKKVKRGEWERSLGRGNKMIWENLDLIFYNSHNIDGHREFLFSIKRSKDSNILLFFSKRPNKEIIQIYNLYKRTGRNNVLIGSASNHYKLLSQPELSRILGISKKNILNLSCRESIKYFCRKNKNSDFFVVGSNYVQSIFKEDEYA